MRDPAEVDVLGARLLRISMSPKTFASGIVRFRGAGAASGAGSVLAAADEFDRRNSGVGLGWIHSAEVLAEHTACDERASIADIEPSYHVDEVESKEIGRAHV